MAMPKFEGTPVVEKAVQRSLESLFKGDQPSQEDLDILKLSPRVESPIKQLCEALEDGKEVGLRASFNALSVDNPWLKILRSKQPPHPGTEGTGQERPQQLTYQLQPLSYFKNKPKREWGVDQIIFDRGSSIFIGDSGSGKSTFVLDMFLSRACDVYFINRRTKPAFLVWIAGESADELYPRIKAFLACHNISEDQLTNFLGLDGHMPFNDVSEVLTFTQEVKAQLASIGVTPETHSIVFVFDTYAKCTPGADENSTQETKVITASIDAIVRDFSSHVAIIHHVNAQNKIRGNGAFKASVDTVWLVTKNESIMNLHCVKMRGAREPEDFTVESRSIVIDENNLGSPDSTAPVIFPSNAGSEKFTPKAHLQMLEVLEEHSQLTSSEWQKHCEERHKITRSAFYRYLKQLTEQDLVNAPSEDEKERGKKVYYSLSPKGVLLVQK
jgi:DNA-binding transcriptional ArsR family regulator